MRKRWALAAGAVIGTAVPASGFYFPNWPGARVPPGPPSLVPPDSPQPGNPPSVKPPAEKPPHVTPVTPVLTPPDEETPPGQVPEPATIVGGLIGLLTVSAVRRRRAR